MYSHPPLLSRVVREKSAEPPVTYCGGPRGNYRMWDNVSLMNAMAAVEKGTSVRKAAEMYRVPRSTLHDHVTGKIAYGAKSGPHPYLNIEEEEELASFLIETAKIGYPRNKTQVLTIVQQIIDDKGIKSVVSNGWWERFAARHPNITLRCAVPLGLSRALAANSTVINKYFDTLEECLRGNKIFDKPAFVYNCDETGLPLNPTSLKVVEEVGAKNPNHITGGTRSQISVLACSCAAGFTIPPFVIFDRKTLNPKLTEGEVPGTLYGLSSNGWMTSELFFHWFKHHFLQYAPKSRPLMLLLDGHSSHYCPAVIKLAAENSVIVFALPPHTTHIAQPLDRGCFSPLKSAWRQICHEFCSNNVGRTVTRYEFSQLFSAAWFKSMTAPNIISSFKACGVCPFDRAAIKLPETKEVFSSFVPEKLAERTGLAYIPLYSPAQTHSHSRVGHNTLAATFNGSLPSKPTCLPDSPVLPLRNTTSISKFLIPPLLPRKDSPAKPSACVLTSIENVERIKEKERKKQEEIEIRQQKKIRRTF